MSEELMDFRFRFKNLRLERRLSTQELADRLQISLSLVNQYESGRRSPTRKRQEELARFFNVDVDYLMGRSDVRQISELKTVRDQALSGHEMAVIEGYRSAPENVRLAICLLLGVTYDGQVDKSDK